MYPNSAAGGSIHGTPNAGANLVPAVISGQIARRRFIARALIMLLPFLGPVAPSFAALPASAPRPSITTIAREARQIVASTAQVEQLADGFDWVEGPLWVRESGSLLFSDVPRNRIYQWSRNGGTRLFLEPSGGVGNLKGFREPGSNGLKPGRPGFLLMADQGQRGIAELNLTTKQHRIIVDRFEGKRFNSPNDLIVGPDGSIWFTDPPYGLEGVDASPLKEQPANGVYRIAADGAVTRVEAGLRYPNGIALSPDARTLYVSNSDPEHAVILAYDVSRSGRLSRRRVFVDMTPLVGTLPGLPDGMVVDVRGNLFATGPGGVHIFTSAGRELSRISTGAAISNCTFGGLDGRTLFMTSTHTVYALRTKVRGTPAWRSAL